MAAGRRRRFRSGSAHGGRHPADRRASRRREKRALSPDELAAAPGHRRRRACAARSPATWRRSSSRPCSTTRSSLSLGGGAGRGPRRFRAGRPVRARPATLAYHWGKLVRRHRVAFVAATATLLSLLAGLATSLWQARVAERERDRAAAAAAEAEDVAAYLVALFRDVDPEQGAGGQVTARELLDRGAERLDGSLADRPLTRARLQEAIGGVYLHLRALEPAERLLTEAVAARERLEGPDAPGPARAAVPARLDHRTGRPATRRHAPRSSAPCGSRTRAAADRVSSSPRGLTLLGNLQLGERSCAAAEATYRRALGALDASADVEEIDRTSVLNNLGVALYCAGSPRRSRGGAPGGARAARAPPRRGSLLRRAEPRQPGVPREGTGRGGGRGRSGRARARDPRRDLRPRAPGRGRGAGGARRRARAPGPVRPRRKPTCARRFASAARRSEPSHPETGASAICGSPGCS